METTILIVIQVLAALALIGLILIQQGKGADAGASFGGGASQSVFGSAGSGNFLTRMTAILATVFFVASLGLAYFGNKATSTESSLFTVPAMETAVDEDLPVVPEAQPATVDEDIPAVEVDVPQIEAAAEDVPAVDAALIQDAVEAATEQAPVESAPSN